MYAIFVWSWNAEEFGEHDCFIRWGSMFKPYTKKSLNAVVKLGNDINEEQHRFKHFSPWICHHICPKHLVKLGSHAPHHHIPNENVRFNFPLHLYL
jgi:hypothetical protein